MLYFIINDRHFDPATYFYCVGFGVFWTSGPKVVNDRLAAKAFTSRALAVKTLHQHGKHLEGWRIIQERQAGRCADL